MDCLFLTSFHHGFLLCVAGTLWLNESVLSGLVKGMLTHSVAKVQGGSRGKAQPAVPEVVLPSCRDPLA